MRVSDFALILLWVFHSVSPWRTTSTLVGVVLASGASASACEASEVRQQDALAARRDFPRGETSEFWGVKDSDDWTSPIATVIKKNAFFISSSGLTGKAVVRRCGGFRVLFELLLLDQCWSNPNTHLVDFPLLFF